MSRIRALAMAALALAGCDGCHSEAPTPDLGATPRQRPGQAPAESEADTPAGRAAAFARALPEARDRAARRATLLADGRTHGRAGRHADALRSFEDALREVEGPDAALHCEAGFQAIQLGQWPLARRHLVAGLSVAVQPRRRAACFYNLALVEEAVDDRAAAIAALEKSLVLRPNATVERKLRALQAAEAESAATEETEEAEEEAPEVHPTLEALCESPCGVLEVEVPERPEGWPELAFVVRPDRQFHHVETTWLVAKDGEGWRDVAEVAMEDIRDMYGALEPIERVTAVVFEDGALRVSVVGHHDEPEGEAEAYFACEEDHAGDSEAIDECFGDAIANQPPAESWAFDLIFGLSEGRLSLTERRAGTATQVGP